MLSFRTAGESHGQALIALVEGIPAHLPIDFEFIDNELKRRQGGYGRGGRMKIEKDQVRFLSGVRHGKTIGSPIAMMTKSCDASCRMSLKRWLKRLSGPKRMATPSVEPSRLLGAASP